MDTSLPTEHALHLAAETMRALAHPIRMQIVLLLHSNGASAVKDIHEALDILQPIASHHLRILKDKQILNNTRDGQNTLYALADERYQQLTQLILSATQAWAVYPEKASVFTVKFR